MNDAAKLAVQDALNEAQAIKGFVSGLDFGTYVNDKRTRYAVERCFEIIGETLNRLHKLEPDVTPAISDFRKIIAFRNILAHAYDHVDTKLVWGIIENDLDKLIADLERLNKG